ncbi:hypothetical protein ACFZ8E_24880 [Methylobacterium sp. HMF5984]|uniref:hypothetical protein n=1 Tax=Methylobacterium sp. HMF5984 TaxID=3367370 RepID=UPI0038535DBC
MAETSTITREHCFACGHAFKDGDPVYEDVNEGLIHEGCCGPEPESYSGPDGEPLKPGDPIPAPFIYRADPGALAVDTRPGPPDLGEYRNFYRRPDGTVRMGPAWRDAGTASIMREVAPSESFITCRNMRFEDTPAYLAALATGVARG